MKTLSLIQPDWPAHPRVKAFSTTRQGGSSQGAYAALNLATHVGDAETEVEMNREALAAYLPNEPVWLNQVHGTQVVDASHVFDNPPDADASYSWKPEVVCAVLTADCLPILLCDEAGTSVAAVHCGWKSLAGGILGATVAAMQCNPKKLMAWMGPAISAAHYQVDAAVRDPFLKHDALAERAFTPDGLGHWKADLYELARERLGRLGIQNIYGGHYCTFEQSELFYSYRRDGTTGRMASLIWLAD